MLSYTNGFENPPRVTTNTWSQFARGPMWEALIHDTGADVAIVAQDGVLLYISPVLRYWTFVDGVTDPIGKTGHQLSPKDIADERKEISQRAIRENKPISIVAMWRGIATVTTVRPFVPEPGKETLLLVTCRADLDESADKRRSDGATVVTAKNMDRGPLASLTPRETEILALIGRGLSTAQIAKTLCRSAKTIEAHRLSLGLKLNARNRVDLARIALKAGLASMHVPEGVPLGQEKVAKGEASADDED